MADVLRKRRNRPDASDEDLGLPRSPITPQRQKNAINQSEGSLSLLSMVSSELDDESSTSVIAAADGSSGAANSSIASGKWSSSQDTSRNSTDEVDLDASVQSAGSKLSHSAARHKMAVRPKKKGPTRHHRKPIDVSVDFSKLIFLFKISKKLPVLSI